MGESLSLAMISIITPCLNRVEFVETAIESVLDQDYPNLEHVVVDGGSTDGTLDALRRYEHVRLISEPDAGWKCGPLHPPRGAARPGLAVAFVHGPVDLARPPLPQRDTPGLTG